MKKQILPLLCVALMGIAALTSCTPSEPDLKKTDYLNLEATYLRPPNAEKNKKLLEAMRHG